MDRRLFMGCCAGGALAAVLGGAGRTRGEVVDLPPALLLDEAGEALRASALPREEALVFAYPRRGLPCFLVRLPAERAGAPGAVGAGRDVVAFLAVCTHQMSYPKPELSVLRYAASGSELADAPGRIVCCAHGSVFDPAEGGRNVHGPAEMPLFPVRLKHDAQTDHLHATGAVDEAFAERFFSAFKPELIERFGPGAYRQEVGETTTAVPLGRYSRVLADC